MSGHQLGALLGALAFAGGLVWLFQLPQVPAPIEAGRAAPPFDLPDLAGEPHRLEALRGKVVLVNFWATWCKPCEDEMPAMERLYQSLQSRGFELLAVSVDDESEPVDAFRERLALSFPILHDPEKRVSGTYQSSRFPESFLIDQEGVLVERYIGPREWDAPAYVARIERLLEGR